MFEQDWKNAIILPIFKDGGEINDENNYCPNSVIGHIAKLMECVVSYQILAFWNHTALFQWTILLV